MAEQSSVAPRVLVVDAEPAIRSLLAVALPLHGLETVGASNAVDAVDALNREHGSISVALLSVRGADGPSTLTALRQIQPNLKAVFMTGDMDPNLAPELLALGASAVVQKPFDLTALATLLLSLVS